MSEFTVAVPETADERGSDLDILKKLHAAIETAQISRGKDSYSELPKPEYSVDGNINRWIALSRVILTHPESGVKTTIEEYQTRSLPLRRRAQVWSTDDMRRVAVTDDDVYFVKLSREMGDDYRKSLKSDEQQELVRLIEESE